MKQPVFTTKYFEVTQRVENVEPVKYAKHETLLMGISPIYHPIFPVAL